MSALVWIDTGYAFFGLVVDAGRVRRAPPIARWALLRPVEDVLRYYAGKGARWGWCG